MKEFPKQYTPKLAEKEIQKLWREKNIGHPRESRTGKTFYIPIPPPNVTGNLHIGHALTLTIQDIMIRYHRMKGDDTLWVPGTDHAGIATQAQVEKKLERLGTSRKALGREKFLEACHEWVSEYGGNIQKQMELLGASVSWDHERYTFDKKSNSLVEEIFVELYNRGYIYRGEYMVNYSPVLESVISDIEVEYREIDEKMYYINYFVAGTDKEIMIATTRPETILADQAVAVHPKDKRYKKLIGRNVILPIVNTHIPIIADEMVDMEFGTGAMKITPAHDPSDFEFAKRHNLPTNFTVIDKNGYMTKEAGPFAGQLAVKEARENIVELLRARGNLVRIEPYRHKIGFCTRGNCRVESVVSTQWFVRSSKMAEKVIEGYKKKEFVIIPERFNKIFEDWIYNLHDWCISRQLWWGHQIPAYYDTNTGELLGVTCNPIEIIEKQAKKYGISLPNEDRKGDNSHSEIWIHSCLMMTNTKRDDDVLDTWFSSALWPFSVLDWKGENPGELFHKYYPANVLETGHDILFFWVIRMLLMGYEFTNQTPFREIYLHGLVLDENGKKMSKSWGNVVDPLEIIEEYSADALRLSLILGNTPGSNLHFSKKTVAEYGLFLNKLWNITRFVSMNIGTITKTRKELEKEILEKKDILLPYERWILSRLSHIRELVTNGLERSNFSLSGLELISFIRDEFADFAIEAYKIEKNRSVIGREAMSLCILDILTLLHPYIPHITEMLHRLITDGEKFLCLDEWPTGYLFEDRESENHIKKVIDIVRNVRNLRAEAKIEPGEMRDVIIIAPSNIREYLENNVSLISGLARISTLSFTEKGPKGMGYTYTTFDGIDIYVDIHIDVEKHEEEKHRIALQIEEKRSYILTLKAKLANNAFLSNAPEKVVRKEMEKLHLAETELMKLEEKYNQLKK